VAKRKGEGRMGRASVKAEEGKRKTLWYETGLEKDRIVFWIGLTELSI
jgi:hypothetical protein